MDSEVAKLVAASALPSGFAAVPLDPNGAHAAVRLCVVVRSKDDTCAPVRVRDSLDASVLLGCLADAAGRVHRWLELWIQDLDHLAGSVAALREALSNVVMDERWHKRHEALVSIEPTDVLTTGWEQQHPTPLWIDPASMQAGPLTSDDGETWTLCTDDALLAKHDLPRYSTSLHRYLYCTAGDGASFAAVTSDAPTNEHARSLAEVAGTRVPLNAGGGLVQVRTFHPMAYDAYVDLLSGEGDSTPSDGFVGTNGLADGRMFLGRNGRSGRLVETFHLKLRLIADAVAVVGAYTRRTQVPLLGLTSDSFRVSAGREGEGLPRLWNAVVSLCDTGDAVALPIKSSSVSYFLRGGSASLSIYQPATSQEATRGRGNLRLRSIKDTKGRSIVKGTFSSDERLEATSSDLVWLRFVLDDQRVDLYGHLEADKGLAPGEWRFRSVEQKLDDATQERFKRGEGAMIQGAQFDVLPLLSTPFDLYALSVLAARTLLVNAKTSLPTVVDELHSLARMVATSHNDDEPLPVRLQRILEDDDRWLNALGPDRLSNDPLSPAEALGIVPIELWSQALASIVRMIPGIGPDSICRDYGDAPPGGVHKIFDVARSDLSTLLTRSRSLIVIDWNANREIHSVVRRYISGTAAEPSMSATES